MESKSLDATEARSAGATHPRVTLDSMRRKIAVESYFTLGEAFDALELPDVNTPHDVDLAPLDVFTLCVLVMDNGWVVTGHSAPASPENFDKEKGRQFAYEKAIAQLWPLEGYLLRNELAEKYKESDDGEE